MLTAIDFTPGKITYNEFHFDPQLPLAEQIWSLKHDILQVAFEDERFILDVGWLPEFDTERGSFIVVVVENYDWDYPLYQNRTMELLMLRTYIEDAINFVKRRISL
ncbi:hypothetical protein MH117_17430 [Paenibacillus sp. ACRRX]|uniref:hypothetical protein n=1 Tax=Paenibacillus sp. ACRRX TaxID=2918206 RepID=UPI001EF5E09C|nr:hypothetical protein [Paenibacillus sp. ACRRX]MCG7409202.1 hypothetical protein [Paenibacillus sp. ACRRX]